MHFSCTKHEGSTYCEKNATSFNIINPIVSARATTQNYLYSLYGKLEVVAKLPTGDWIVSGKYNDISNTNWNSYIT